MTSRPPDPSAEGRYLYQMSKRASRAWRAGLACVLFAPLLACGGEPGEETTLDPGPAAGWRRRSGDLVASWGPDCAGRASRWQQERERRDHRSKRALGRVAAESVLPRLRRRHEATGGRLRRLRWQGGTQVRVQLRPLAGRVPTPDSGLPRQVVRRLQHRLHADPAEERQVLHRGDLFGRRSLVQRRFQSGGGGPVPLQGPAGRASPTPFPAGAPRTKRRSSSPRSRRTCSASNTRRAGPTSCSPPSARTAMVSRTATFQ